MNKNILHEIWNFLKIKYDIQLILHQEKKSYNSFHGYSNESWRILDDLILRLRTFFNNAEFLTNKPYGQLDLFISLTHSHNSHCLIISNIIVNTFVDYEVKKFPNKSNILINDLNNLIKQFSKKYDYNQKIIYTINEIQLEKTLENSFIALENKKYGATKKEYLDALESFNDGRYQDTLVHSNKALESLLKCICDDRGIYRDKDTVNALVEILKNNNFFDDFVYLIANINNLAGLFQTGVNSLRNKSAAHGGGQAPHDPDYNLAQLSLNLSISYINFLININEKTI